MTDKQHTVSESADKIVLKTKIKRGNDVRNEDKIDVKVKGNNPEETAAKLAETLYQLDQCAVPEHLRETQPGESDE